jgi:hypothetical protein
MPLPLWIWLEYPVIPRYLQLNLLAIQHHAGNDFELKLLNRSTLGSLLDLPPEFARVPYAVAASDFARIGLLAMYGGLYMDADFLVARPLAPLATLLERYDVVSSSDAGDESCARGWSPNFVAARPRTPLWMEAWTSLTNQLKRRCGPPARHKICCYQHRNNTPVPCRVPWGLTDRVVRPVFRRQLDKPGAPKMHCFAKKHGFAPSGQTSALFGGCMRNYHIQSLKLPSDHPPRELSRPAYKLPPDATNCYASGVVCQRRGADLVCAKNGSFVRGSSSVSVNFYHRIAYHLFESIYGRLFASYTRVEDSNLVVAELYRQALRDVPIAKWPAAFAMEQRVQIKGE